MSISISAIAAKLVAKMGGKMIVDSEVGRGSRFSFEVSSSHFIIYPLNYYHTLLWYIYIYIYKNLSMIVKNG